MTDDTLTQPDEPTAPTKRRGRIRISASLLEHLGNPTTPQDWHTALLLPDRYEVERIDIANETGQGLIEVWVRSEDIPDVDAHIAQLEVSPVYRQEMYENEPLKKTVFLARIDFSYWDGQHWQTIPGTEERSPRSREMAIQLSDHAALFKSEENEVTP